MRIRKSEEEIDVQKGGEREISDTWRGNSGKNRS